MTTLQLPIVPDAFDHYMTQVNRFDLLSREDEVALARRYRQHGDIEAAHRLITSNLRFVVKVANEYRHYGVKLIDLVQEGNIGLMMAVKKFDPERGIRLISYAVWWIRAYIQNYILKSWSLVKIGTTQAQKKLFFKLKQTKAALLRLTGREDETEIADQLDVRTDEVAEMTARLRSRDASLDLELVEGDDYTLLSTLADERENQEELLAEKQQQDVARELAGKALATLNAREQEIIRARILADDQLTLQELADRFGISRERVRQLEQNALKKMKGALGPHPAGNQT
ncbi:MAG TPA: RNA polymerase sigma factor RpoH [Geothermobacteraceae bacterium]|nr:RNA polymerase sigma factor RpoH [Geothermobacteraceae bacterium]